MSMYGLAAPIAFDVLETVVIRYPHEYSLLFDVSVTTAREQKCSTKAKNASGTQTV